MALTEAGPARSGPDDGSRDEYVLAAYRLFKEQAPEGVPREGLLTASGCLIHTMTSIGLRAEFERWWQHLQVVIGAAYTAVVSETWDALDHEKFRVSCCRALSCLACVGHRR